jgi:hypothetical protein
MWWVFGVWMMLSATWLAPVVCASTQTSLPAGSTVEQLETMRQHQQAEGKVQLTPTPMLLPQHLQVFHLWYSQLPLKERQQLEARANDIALLQQALTGLMGDEAPEALSDLTLLWQEAIQRSQSINYALEKLNRKEEGSKQSAEQALATRKFVNGLAQLGGAATSLLTASPVGLMSGAFVGDVLATTAPDVKKRLNDADMVILAKAIDELQRQLLEQYYALRQQQQRVRLHQEHLLALEHTQKKVLQEALPTEASLIQRSTEHVLQGLRREVVQEQQQLNHCYVRLQTLVGSEVLQQLSIAQTKTPEQ